MTNRLLFIPGFCSPESARTLGQTRPLIEELERAFAVEIMSLPGIRGAEPCEPEWPAVARVMTAAILPGRHVVSTGWVGALTLIAITLAQVKPLSLVARGMVVPPATLRALGRHAAADAASVSFEAGRVPSGTAEMSRILSPEAPEEETSRVADALNDEVDWPFFRAFLSSYERLDLIAEKPRVECPVLFVDFADVAIPGFNGMSDVFLEVVPQARVETGDAAAPRQGAQQIIDFIRRLEAEEDGQAS